MGLLALSPLLLAMTPILVRNNYSTHPAFGLPVPTTLNIRISGAGVGGCDVVLNSPSSDNSTCDCLWGTVGYQFKAFTHDADANEWQLCADTKSLGNCYHNKGYSCEVTSLGFCHCDEL
jgi:hypothetical protein